MLRSKAGSTKFGAACENCESRRKRRKKSETEALGVEDSELFPLVYHKTSRSAGLFAREGDGRRLFFYGGETMMPRGARAEREDAMSWVREGQRDREVEKEKRFLVHVQAKDRGIAAAETAVPPTGRYSVTRRCITRSAPWRRRCPRESPFYQTRNCLFCSRASSLSPLGWSKIGFFISASREFRAYQASNELAVFLRAVDSEFWSYF